MPQKFGMPPKDQEINEISSFGQRASSQFVLNGVEGRYDVAEHFVEQPGLQLTLMHLSLSLQPSTTSLFSTTTPSQLPHKLKYGQNT